MGDKSIYGFNIYSSDDTGNSEETVSNNKSDEDRYANITPKNLYDSAEEYSDGVVKGGKTEAEGSLYDMPKIIRVKKYRLYKEG